MTRRPRARRYVTPLQAALQPLTALTYAALLILIFHLALNNLGAT